MTDRSSELKPDRAEEEAREIASIKIERDFLRDLLDSRDTALAEAQERIRAFETALEPFANGARVIDAALADDVLLFSHYPSLFGGQTEIRVGDLRRARTILSPATETEGEK